VAHISIDPGHDIFNGHFPGQPVVPGVCMIQIVKELLEAQWGRSLLLQDAGQVKFLQLLQPIKDELLEVHIGWKEPVNDTIAVTASFKKAAAAVFKLTGTFRLV